MVVEEKVRITNFEVFVKELFFGFYIQQYWFSDWSTLGQFGLYDEWPSSQRPAQSLLRQKPQASTVSGSFFVLFYFYLNFLIYQLSWVIVRWFSRDLGRSAPVEFGRACSLSSWAYISHRSSLASSLFLPITQLVMCLIMYPCLKLHKRFIKYMSLTFLTSLMRLSLSYSHSLSLSFSLILSLSLRFSLFSF